MIPSSLIGRAARLMVLAGLGVGSVDSAGAQIIVVGSSVLEQEVPAGEAYTGQIRLLNQGADPQAVRVYQADYLFYADGRNLYPEPGSHQRSNGDWITVAPTDLVVAPGEEREVAFRVAVPSAPADGPGTYWSMIMVEPTEPVTAEPREAGPPAIGLQTTVRFGVQVATHVAEDAEHRLGLGNPRVVAGGDGRRQLEFELVNEGELAFRPRVSLELYDETGTLATTMEAQRGLIYPGTSTLQTFELGALPAGKYQAAIVVDPGAMELFGAQYSLTLR